MIAAAADSGVVLAVGQTERFNPAVEAARPMLTDPRFIEVHRLGTFPERSLDIDVVFDLMIHDLDVVLSLVHSEVESIEAVGVPVLTGRVDIANARLRFANGCIANLTASRISRDRVRKIRFFQPAAYVSIDYAAQKVEMYRLVKGEGPKPTIQGGDVPVVNEEPLKRELADFVDAVTSKRAPLVDGLQGRRALELATRDHGADGISSRDQGSGIRIRSGRQDHGIKHPDASVPALYGVSSPALCGVSSATSLARTYGGSCASKRQSARTASRGRWRARARAPSRVRRQPGHGRCRRSPAPDGPPPPSPAASTPTCRPAPES